MQILRIDSATTGEASVSREVTDAIAAHFEEKYPDATWVTRDLSADPLPHLNEVTTGAIRWAQEDQTEEMRAVFQRERAVYDEFTASDIVIIGAPMYNFTIPSNLKAWIDRLGVPRVAFRYSENGVEGLAGGRRVIIASTRGGSYEEGHAADHQESLLKTVFGFIGVDDITFVRVENTGFGPEAREEGLGRARDQIARL